MISTDLASAPTETINDWRAYKLLDDPLNDLLKKNDWDPGHHCMQPESSKVQHDQGEKQFVKT